MALSVTTQNRYEMAEQIELFSVLAAALAWLMALYVNGSISKNNGTSPWNFVPNSGLRKILQWHIIHCKCCQLSLTDNVTSLSY